MINQLQQRLDAAYADKRKWAIIWRRDNSYSAFYNMERAEARVIKLETQLREETA